MDALSLISLGAELEEALVEQARIECEIRLLDRELAFEHKLVQAHDRLTDEIADLRLMIIAGTPRSEAEAAIVVANAHHAMRQALDHPNDPHGMRWVAICARSAARAMHIDV